jgi:hypothetical protein
MTRFLFAFVVILGAVFSRLLPHPPNFTPIAAIALFGGVYLDRRAAFIVPLAALLVSDYVLGFYRDIAWVYGSFVLIGLIGLWLRSHRSLVATAAATLTGSIVFFLVTNFGVWVSSQVTYPKTLAGLVECYVAAIPFFRNSVAGDLVYVALLFGAYEFGMRYVLRRDAASLTQ